MKKNETQKQNNYQFFKFCKEMFYMFLMNLNDIHLSSNLLNY